MKAYLLARSLCMLQGSNPRLGREVFCTFRYKDAVVVSAFKAHVAVARRHQNLLCKCLQAEGVAVVEFAFCDCGECWVMVLEGPLSARQVAAFVWATAMECASLPLSDEVLWDLSQPLLGPFPTVDAHCDWLAQLESVGLLRCAHAVGEGQVRCTSF